MSSTRYTVSKEVEFDAAHYLPDYQGKCCNMHGHRWKARFTVTAEQLNPNGMVVDFNVLSCLANLLDHRLVNDKIANPTAELMAEWFFDALSMDLGAMPNKPQVVSVEVWETPTSYAKFELGE